MDARYIKKFFEACHDAKKITELMPALPEGIKPRHIHVIDEIKILSQKEELVKVSDISDALKVTRPSITKLIMELEEKNVVIKSSCQDDNRIITLTLTELGKEYYDIYVEKYYAYLTELFKDFKEEDMEIATETISNIYKIMKTEVH